MTGPIGSARANLVLALPALVLMATVTLGTAALSPAFLSSENIVNLENRVLPLALVALGETVVLLGGRIDLSVGSIVSLATAIMAVLSDQIGWLAVPAALLAGLACGAATAAGIVLLDVNPLIMTLATASIVKGVTLLILSSPGGEVAYDAYEWLFGLNQPFAAPFWLTFGAFAIAAAVLGWTRLGRQIYALGSDPRAAFANGVSVGRLDFILFSVSGVLSAAAGVVLSIRTLSGDPLIGDPYTLDAITAVILGGVALQGGRGHVFGVCLAVISLVQIDNAINLLGLRTDMQSIVKGLVVVAALVVFLRRSKTGEGR
jgi:ribose transport system permease protein